MWYERIEKFTALVLAMAIVASVGLYIRRQNRPISPKVSVSDKVERFKVTIDGEVEKPGIYSVAKGTRICDVIYAAGGITPNADIDVVDLNAIVVAQSEIHIPAVNKDSVSDVVPIININTADKEELTLVPGIGEVTAQRIIDYRINNGDFSEISDIMNVNGIGEKKFEEIKNYIITSEINNTEE